MGATPAPQAEQTSNGWEARPRRPPALLPQVIGIFPRVLCKGGQGLAATVPLSPSLCSWPVSSGFGFSGDPVVYKIKLMGSVVVVSLSEQSAFSSLSG